MYFAAASYSLEQAQRAFGRLCACQTFDETLEVFKEFLPAIRAVPAWISQLGFENAERNNFPMTDEERRLRIAFDDWFKMTSATVVSHPLNLNQQFALASSRQPSDPISLDVDFLGEEITADLIVLSDEPRSRVREPTTPDDIYVDFDRSRSIADVCAHYLAEVTLLFEAAKQELTRIGLEPL